MVPATSSLLSMLPPCIQGGAESYLPPDGGAMPMLPKKGCSGMSMPGAKWPIIFWRSSGMILRFAVGKVVGEEAATGAEGVAGPGDIDVDFLDADFEDVARLGLFNGDRSGEDVAAGTFFAGGNLGVDVIDVRRDVGCGDAEGLEALGWAAGGEGLDGDGVAGFDGESRFGACGIEAPGYRRGRGEKSLSRLLGARYES